MYIVTPVAQVHLCEILWLRDFSIDIDRKNNNGNKIKETTYKRVLPIMYKREWREENRKIYIR